MPVIFPVKSEAGAEPIVTPSAGAAPIVRLSQFVFKGLYNRDCGSKLPCEPAPVVPVGKTPFETYQLPVAVCTANRTLTGLPPALFSRCCDQLKPRPAFAGA